MVEVEVERRRKGYFLFFFSEEYRSEKIRQKGRVKPNHFFYFPLSFPPFSLPVATFLPDVEKNFAFSSSLKIAFQKCAN